MAARLSRASGSYERQTTTPPPQPLLLTNWCEEREARSPPPVNQTSIRPFTRSALPPPPRRPRPPSSVPLSSFFFIFGGKPHRIHNGDGDEDGNEILQDSYIIKPAGWPCEMPFYVRKFTTRIRISESRNLEQGQYVRESL